MLRFTTNDPALIIEHGLDRLSVLRNHIVGLKHHGEDHFALIFSTKNAMVSSMPIMFNGVQVNSYATFEMLLMNFMKQGEVIQMLGVIDDFTFDIPAGYMLDFIVAENLTAQNPTLDLGLSAGGGEIFAVTPFNPNTVNNGLQIISIRQMFDQNLSTTLYLTDDHPGCSWDGATMNFYIFIKKTI